MFEVRVSRMKSKRKQINQTDKNARMKAEEAPSVGKQREAADDRCCLACSVPLPSSRAVPGSQECSQGRQGASAKQGGGWR